MYCRRAPAASLLVSSPGKAAGIRARRAPGSRDPGSRHRAARRCLIAILALGVGACGGGSDSPAVPNACAFVPTPEGALELTLPGTGFLSYSIVSEPAKGSLAAANRLTGEFIYTPTPGLRGRTPLLEDSFQFQAHGPDGSSNIATFRLVYAPRIMALGDSITWGGPGETGTCPQHVGYRKPLYDSLRAAGYVVNFVGTLRSGQSAGLSDPDHEGHGAWSADDLVDGRSGSCAGSGQLGQWLDQTEPDVILLHAGTNDLNGAGSGSGDPVEEAQDIGRILGVINGWEPANWPVQVLVARIIVNHRRGQEATTLFNDTVLREIVEPAIGAGDDVISVDQENALDSLDYYLDDLHPNPEGYARMADAWMDALTGILPKCP